MFDKFIYVGNIFSKTVANDAFLKRVHALVICKLMFVVCCVWEHSNYCSSTANPVCNFFSVLPVHEHCYKLVWLYEQHIYYLQKSPLYYLRKCLICSELGIKPGWKTSVSLCRFLWPVCAQQKDTSREIKAFLEYPEILL